MKEETKKNQEREKREEEKKKRKRKIVLILLMIFLLLLMGTCRLVENKDKEQSTTEEFTIDEDSSVGGKDTIDKAKIQKDLNKKVKDGMINISMNTNVKFEKGTAKGNLQIINEDINRYPQLIEIYIDKTQQLIYKSNCILVGSKIDYAKLQVNLKKGVYQCTAYFNSVNLKTNRIVGKAGAKITVTVLN